MNFNYSVNCIAISCFHLFPILNFQLSNTTNILNEAQQPYNYLIESIRVRDSQIKSLQENNQMLEEDIR
jgi:progesterone-induced-blocking factor 1